MIKQSSLILAWIIGLVAACLLPPTKGMAGGDKGAVPQVRFDFESDALQDWTVTQGKFDKLISFKPPTPEILATYNAEGNFCLSTLERADGSPNESMTGVAESSVFILHGPAMSLRVGGGSGPDTYLALCTLDGDEILKAHGANSEKMRRVAWNAPQLVGKPVYLKLVDRATGAWGHITFDDFSAEGVLDQALTHAHLLQAENGEARKQLAKQIKSLDFGALKAAITDLAATFPGQYSRSGKYLKRLDAFERRWPKMKEKVTRTDFKTIKECDQYFSEFLAFQREALSANPLVCGQPILFVVRRQYTPDHHNTETMFLTGEVNTGSFRGGGALKAIDHSQGGKVTTLLETRDGVIRDPEVHFGGRKIVFSMRKNIEDDYKIYEINADGSGLKQLTVAKGVADIDPFYLPDDGIGFSSTREPKYCMCNIHIMANLYRMDGDGANIHQIGKNTLFEGHGSLMPDGRILYDRWEYVDRNFGDAQGLWTVNPDGTNHEIYWGNNTPAPGAVIDARAIPGTEQVLCILGSCHDRPWGALGIIDRRLGLDGRRPIVRTWPAEAADLAKEDGFGLWDATGYLPFKYEDPYPLSDKYFLCSRMTGHGEQMGLYLLDTFGNEVLLHSEMPGCYDPMPLAPRSRPPVIPARRNFENKEGFFYVDDVYRGVPMQGVKRGTVKYLRVVESPEKRFWTDPAWNGQGVERPAMNWNDFSNKRILGTVPVEADGSAYFAVPADKFIYFQLLDKDGMMVQSMRSGAIVQSGEKTGCIGCHDERRSAPAAGQWKMPSAVQRAPSQLGGWRGEPRLFNFMDEVQPVFDKHCIECHDYGKEAGRKLNLAPDRDLTFNTSYNELWRKHYTGAIGAGPAQVQQAYAWGSHASPLIKTLQAGHQGIKLDPESFERLVTWIDLNAPYYPVFASAFPDNLSGRAPLDNKQLQRLAELTGVDFVTQANNYVNQGPQVCFERPELSPCLAKLKANASKDYQEALGIIRAGQATLKAHPNADMKGFLSCPLDQKREQRYETRRSIELRNREAIRKGEKIYDGTAE